MRKRIEWGDNESFISNYQKLKSSRRMAEIYSCDKKSVLNHAKSIGFACDELNIPLSNEIKRIIIDSYLYKSSSELATELKIPKGTITKIWHDNGLKGKKRKGIIRCDLTNKQFGRLKVISPTDKRDINGNIIWKCECDCGNTNVEYPSCWIVEGKVVSCGCVSKQNLEMGRNLYDDKTGKKFGKLTVIEKCENYTSDKLDAVQWLCQCECTRFTKVLASNLSNGNTTSCGLCFGKSKGEDKIESLLKQYSIPYEREKRFDDCKYKNKLSFDFYINNKYCLEYDGKLHFQENNCFGDDFEIVQLRDRIKNEWCLKNNIPLIRIPYTILRSLTIDDILLDTSQYIYEGE